MSEIAYSGLLNLFIGVLRGKGWVLTLLLIPASIFGKYSDHMMRHAEHVHVMSWASKEALWWGIDEAFIRDKSLTD